MYHFELDKKLAGSVARIDGGQHDNKCVHIEEYSKEKDTKKKKEQFLKELSMSEYELDLKSLPKSERPKIRKLLEDAFLKGYTEEDIDDASAKPLYKKILDNEAKNDKIVIHDGKFTVVPMKDKFQLFYCVGACGSGKSYMALNIAKNYKKIYPKREVYLISKLPEDSTLDKGKFIKRIKAETFLDEAPTIEEFSDSLVIVDDYESFEKKLYEAVIKLINDIASMGIHYNINMICCQHNFTNYKATRLMLNEMTHVIVYPSSASNQALKYLLGTYCGLDTKQIQEVKKAKSRWVVVHKHHPNFIMTEDEIKFMS